MTSTRIPPAAKNSQPAPPPAAPEPWTIASARSLYNIEGWGIGFFDINEAGHVVVRPDREKTDRELDLFELASDLEGGLDAVLVVVDLDDVGNVEQPDR